jgi:8-oxo-dGTP pyrophosphatase MutT (NUDIX family)
MRSRERGVVRALIVSPESNVLLVQIHLSDRSFWNTPGGGIENQESRHQALQRELSEEIGLHSLNIGPAVWLWSHTFDFEGETLTQHEVFRWVAYEWFKPPEKCLTLMRVNTLVASNGGQQGNCLRREMILPLENSLVYSKRY